MIKSSGIVVARHSCFAGSMLVEVASELVIPLVLVGVVTTTALSVLEDDDTALVDPEGPLEIQ